MCFALGSLRYVGHSNSPMQQMDYMAICIDAAIFTVIASISIPIIVRAGFFTPMKVTLCTIGVGINCIFLVIDGTAIIVRINSPPKPLPVKQEVHSLSSHRRIINNLHIGNERAFLSVTHLNFTYRGHSGKEHKVKTYNKYKFDVIITCCPLEAIYKRFQEVGKIADSQVDDISYFSNHFKIHDVEWIHIGEMFGDSSNLWNSIIYDCTYKDPPRKFTGRLPFMDNNEIKEMIDQKAEYIHSLPVNQMFENIFNKIDEALQQGKKILVHCQKGKSRSPTIVILYLINRKNMTAGEAINFVKEKKPDINPVFINQINQYAHDLRNQG